MGRFMIPCCCICGKASKFWHDPIWEQQGGLQDFCPNHANKEMVVYDIFPMPLIKK